MAPFDGSLARTLDFGETTTTAPVYSGGRSGLRLALPGGVLRGPGKYKVLETRRRQAQITARRALDLIEAMERTAGGGERCRAAPTPTTARCASNASVRAWNDPVRAAKPGPSGRCH